MIKLKKNSPKPRGIGERTRSRTGERNKAPRGEEGFFYRLGRKASQQSVLFHFIVFYCLARFYSCNDFLVLRGANHTEVRIRLCDGIFKGHD